MISFKQFLSDDYNEYALTYPTKNSKWVIDQMKAKGYKVLGKGADKAAFIDGNNNVIVIVGPIDDKNPTRGKLFIEWAKFCQKRKNNPYLPDIIDYSEFEAPFGAKFLQIKMEKMFPATDNLGKEVEDLLDDLASLAGRANGNIEKFKKAIDEYVTHSGWNSDYDTQSKAVVTTLMHIPDFELFATTIFQVMEEGRKLGYTIDLHDANYMLSSNGELVIVDPWYGGW